MSYILFLTPVFVLFILVYISYEPKALERELTMVILSKDKTKCAEYNRLAVQRNYGNGKDKKYALVGSVGHHSDILNSYPTKEAAVTAIRQRKPRSKSLKESTPPIKTATKHMLYNRFFLFFDK